MTSAYRSITTGTPRRTAAQTVAAVVGVVFLLVGVAGFIPGVTTNYDQLTFAGHHSEALLLGIFQVSILHNIVHLLFGIAGLLMARTHGSARIYLIGGGVIYLLLMAYGFFVDQGSQANFVPLNSADNVLHLVLGVGMIGLGLVTGRQATATVPPSRGSATSA
ncbi:DUF4383 domain-containing protein [Nakamurella flava]|uniref:DUF4383 domain-containing protein n=1 Tax=Nakamurella flava TaxID=2576308 RepID=A0A4U6QIU6_9ACTN|nr:DUF4383 domain-containing protein [Nakamurella flava]TKV60320.1 DUF4383 domain-containing protein [Nakamurella flava]